MNLRKLIRRGGATEQKDRKAEEDLSRRNREAEQRLCMLEARAKLQRQ